MFYLYFIIQVSVPAFLPTRQYNFWWDSLKSIKFTRWRSFYSLNSIFSLNCLHSTESHSFWQVCTLLHACQTHHLASVKCDHCILIHTGRYENHVTAYEILHSARAQRLIRYIMSTSVATIGDTTKNESHSVCTEVYYVSY